MKTTHLNVNEWLISIALAGGTFVVGFLMRFIPVVEDASDFFENPKSVIKSSAAISSDEIEVSI